MSTLRDWASRTLWAAIGIIGYISALSLTHNDAPVLTVADSLVSQCLPDNEDTIAQMTLQRDDSDALFLNCEKHESMGYGKAPRKHVHIQVAISTD